MKKRSIGMMILLTVITLGLYPIFWSVAVQSEIKDRTGKGFGGFGHFILLFITFGIYYIVWHYKVGDRIKTLGGVDNGLLYLILALVSLVWLTPFLIQLDINKVPTRGSERLTTQEA